MRDFDTELKKVRATHRDPSIGAATVTSEIPPIVYDGVYTREYVGEVDPRSGRQDPIHTLLCFPSGADLTVKLNDSGDEPQTDHSTAQPLNSLIVSLMGASTTSKRRGACYRIVGMADSLAETYAPNAGTSASTNHLSPGDLKSAIVIEREPTDLALRSIMITDIPHSVRSYFWDLAQRPGDTEASAKNRPLVKFRFGSLAQLHKGAVEAFASASLYSSVG